MAIRDKIKYEIEADSSQLNKELDKTGKKLDDTGQKGFNAFRLKLVAGIAVATAAVGKFVQSVGSWIQAQSELTEATSKFNVVFGDVQKRANLVKNELTEAYGLSRIEATKLLAATGDLLTGFGLTGDAALDISEQVNKLAVDLASFSNAAGGAEAVSQALTKALLGERESLKTYGIAIREADIQQRLLEKGQDKLTGTALRQAKAYATLELSLEQSKNAIGDFARTQDSFANQSRMMQSDLQDLSSTLGERFTDSAGMAVREFRSLVGEIDEYLKKPTSEKMEEERVALNVMVAELIDANTEEERRNTIIGKINAQYEDFLEGLDTEKLDLEEIVKRLKEYNEESIKRIALQQAFEEQQASQAQAAEKLRRVLEAENRIREKYIKLMGDQADVTLSVDEMLQQIDETTRRTLLGGTVSQATELQAGLTAAQTMYKRALEESKRELEFYNRLVSDYGNLLEDDANPATEDQKKRVEELVEGYNNLAEALGSNVRISMRDIIQFGDETVKSLDETYKKTQEMSAKYTDLGQQLITAFTHGVRLGEEGALKEALRNVLHTVLSFIEKEVLLAQAKVVLDSIFTGGISNIKNVPELLAIMGLVGTARAAIASFATGVEDYRGGVAKVHKDELIQLPQGTNVYTKTETKQMLGRSDKLLQENNKLMRQLISLQKGKFVLKGRDLERSIDRVKKNRLVKT